MSTFPEVVRSTVAGHPVVAVRCSNVTGRPWLTVHVDKGWTTAEPDDALEGRQQLLSLTEWWAYAGPSHLEVPRPAIDLVTGGVHPDWVTDRIRARLREELSAFRLPTDPGIHVEDSWRVTAHDDKPFEADPVEAWAYCVDAIDRYGFVDRIEQQVDGTWRQRSIRDLLEAAGGDPL